MKEVYRIGRMHKEAEWHLYNYQTLKAREARTREEIEEDAYASAYYTDTEHVRSSAAGSKTERAGILLATTRGKTLSPVEQMWIKAIEDTWVMFTHEDPPKAYLMERVFGLTGRRAVKENKGAIRDEVMHALHLRRIPTFYAAKRDVVGAVVETALELKTYGKVKGPRQ